MTANFNLSVNGYPRPDYILCSQINGVIAINTSITHRGSGKLEIKDVTSNHSGIYQCTASNRFGNTHAKFTLEVNFHPRITLKKGPICRKPGSNITLPKCHVTGHPKPTVTWLKVIGTLPRNRTVVKDGQLTLLRSEINDSGFYLCKAENLFNYAMAEVKVVVFDLPVSKTKFHTTSIAKINTSISFHCIFKNQPQRDICWMKEDGSLSTSRHEIKDNMLILRDLKVSDSGVFMCTATSAGVRPVVRAMLHVIDYSRDCSEIYDIGERRNGVYTIKPDEQDPFRVYCDMTTDRGGWTVFQRRQDGSVDFYRKWVEYKKGFGDLNGEFWLGNDYIHRLTARISSSLRNELGNWDGTSKFAKYGSFSVADESDKYRLWVSSYSGTAGDAMKKHDTMFFTTKDRDHDILISYNCAKRFHGAWWYRVCYDANLNGKYIAGNRIDSKGVVWETYTDQDLSLKRSEMKTRPKDWNFKGDSSRSMTAPSALVTPSHLIINESMAAIFNLSVSGSPLSDVVCIKVNSSTAISTSIRPRESGELEIKYVTPNHSGIYQCTTSNKFGKAYTTFTLEVNFRPRLILNKGPICDISGSNITLPTCHATGHPKPTVTWSKAIGTLPKNRTVAKDGQLTLLRSEINDSGFYWCKAENRFGSVVGRAELVVIELPPSHIKPPKTSVARPGTSVSFDCTPKGISNPAVCWMKESSVLPVERYEIKHHFLILRDLKVSDSGVFLCTATSAGVRQVVRAMLHVMDYPKDCSEIYDTGERRSGVYTIKPDEQDPFRVYCDMKTDGGGWTVFQRRQDGSVEFYRNWEEYKKGFGDLNGEFWLGNDYIHRLTARISSSLRIELDLWDGTSMFAKYGSFVLPMNQTSTD